MDELKYELRRLWSQHPHAKIWLTVTSVVVIVTFVTTLYYLNAGKQDQVSGVLPAPVAVTDTPTATAETPTPSPASKAPAKSKSTKSPASSPASSAAATPSPVSNNETVQTLASKLQSIDVSGLSATVQGYRGAVGQFNN